MKSGLIPTFVKMAHDENSQVRNKIAWFFEFATASHNLEMVKEIVSNDGVAAICSMFTSENGPNTQIEALAALENIIRTTASVGQNRRLRPLQAGHFGERQHIDNGRSGQQMAGHDYERSSDPSQDDDEHDRHAALDGA